MSIHMDMNRSMESTPNVHPMRLCCMPMLNIHPSIIIIIIIIIIIETPHSQRSNDLVHRADDYICASNGNIALVLGFDIEYHGSKRATVSIWRARMAPDMGEDGSDILDTLTEGADVIYFSCSVVYERIQANHLLVSLPELMLSVRPMAVSPTRFTSWVRDSITQIPTRSGTLRLVLAGPGCASRATAQCN